MGYTAHDLRIGETYLVRFCSGECCDWVFLGTDSRSVAWWQGVASGRIFNEGSVMYAWEVLGTADQQGGPLERSQ